jgi:alpha-galactosidase
LVVGVLSELEAFSSLDIDLRSSPVRLHLWSGGDDVPLAPDRPFATDWAYLQVVPIDDPDPLGPYLRAAGIVGRSRAMDVDSSPLSGWCSWYRWFSRVDEEGVRENLDWLRLRRARLPLDVFLLDDGYERQIGDWYPPWPRFPQGPTTLAREVKAAGMKPGLWMAPFIATPTSDAVRDHPDWILRDFGGNPVPVGLVGNSYPYALDSSHPDVLDHLSKLVNAAVDDWGFEVLKLDFLYAAALAGRRHDPAATRAQTFRRALSRLRSAAGDRWIVGCGCPLGPAIGLVDSMRVSPDVAPHWHPHVRGIQPILRGETTIPAARNSIRNAVNLAPLHRRWWINDPDCVLLRPEPSGWADAAPPPHSEGRAWKDTWAWLRRRTRRLGLIDDEVKTLLTLNYLTGGSLIDSDHLPEFDAADETRLARLLPPLDGPGRAADWFDGPYPSAVVAPLHGAAGEWWLLALVNWSDRPRPMSASPASLRMPATALQGVDLWGEEYVRWPEGNLITPVLPPHAVYFTALRPISHTPGWLGDTFDLSGGQAVAAQARAAGSLRIRLELPRRAAGRGWVWLPAPPLRIRADGMPVPWSEDGDGVYRMDLAWDHSSELVIEWPPESALGRLRP